MWPRSSYGMPPRAEIPEHIDTEPDEKGNLLWALGSYILGQTYWRLCAQNRITNEMAFSQHKIVRKGGEPRGTREQSVLKIPGAPKHTLGVGRRDRGNISKEPSRVPPGVNGVDVRLQPRKPAFLFSICLNLQSTLVYTATPSLFSLLTKTRRGRDGAGLAAVGGSGLLATI